MARNIGSVEVTVDANTGRLVAKARKDGRAAGSSYASEFEDQMGDIDGRELLAKLKLIRAKAEAELRNIEIDVGIDDAAARAGLRALEARLRAAEMEVSIDPELNTTRFQAELQALRVLVRDIRVDVKADVKEADVLAAHALIDTLMGEIEVEVEPRVDNSAWARLRTRLETWGGDTGDGAGRRFGRGFSDSFSDGSEVAMRAIILFGDNAYEVLEGALGGITALASSAAFALAGVGTAGVTTIAGIGAAATASVVGMEGFGDALSKINDEFEESSRGNYHSELVGALANLSPNARAAARAFGEVRGALRDVRMEVQDELFAGIDETIRSMAEESLPEMEEALLIAAGSVNEFVRELGEVSNNIDWVGTMQALDPSLDNMFEAAKDLVGVLPPMLEAAGPAAEVLSGAISDAVADFREWVQLNPDELEDFFRDGADSLLEWTGLLGSVGSLLGTIFGSGRGSGDRFIREFDGMVRRWDEWLSSVEGQQALDDFFGDAEETLRDMAPFFEGLGEFIQTLSSESGGEQFAGLMESMGEAMPTIAEALALIGDLGMGEVFLDMLGGLQPVFDLLNSLPDEVLKLVGTFVAVDRTMRLASRAAQALGVSLGTIQKANPYLLAIGAGLTAALFAMDAFSGGNRNAERATQDFANALDGAVDEVVRAQDSANAAAAATEALTTAFSAGDAGEKLQRALGRMNVQLEDVAPNLVNMREGSDTAQDALRNLALAADLPAEAAEELAAIVNASDFNHWTDSSLTAIEEGGHLNDMFKELSESTGISEDRLRQMAESMEVVQDEATNIELDKVAQKELELALGAEGATAELAAQALELHGLNAETDLSSLSTEELVAVYESYVAALYEAEGATQAQADALGETTSAYQIIQDQIALSIENERARVEALKASRKEAHDAYRQEIRDAQDLRQAVAEIATEDFGLPPGFAEGVIELGEAWDAATQAAEDFNSVMEVMRGGIPDLESAVINTEQAFRDAAAGITEMNEAGEEVAVTTAPLEELRTQAGELVSVFDLGSETGAEFAGAARDIADAALEEAAAMIQSGASTEETTERMGELRQSLLDQLEAWGVPIELAEEYADTLLGTPEELTTAISQPGLIEALLNAEDLTLLYDDAGNPVITEFEAMGLDPALANSQVFADLLSQLTGMEVRPSVAVEGGAEAETQLENTAEVATGLSDTVATPSIELVGNVIVLVLLASISGLLDQLDVKEASPEVSLPSFTDVSADLLTLTTAVGDLDADSAAPGITLPTYTVVTGQLKTLQTNFDKFDRDRAAPRITLPTYSATRGQLNTLQQALDRFDADSASPDITVPTYASVHEKLKQLARDVRDIPSSKSITITTPGIFSAIDNVIRLRNNIESLRDRTVTIRTNNVSSGLPGAMAGELITGPTVRNVGEFGLAEAIVPLELPLNRVDPAVRWMAELIRGEGMGRPGLTVNQTIQPLLADPEAVAVQTVNRIAAVLA